MARKTFVYADLPSAVWRKPDWSLGTLTGDGSRLRIAEQDDSDEEKSTFRASTRRPPATVVEQAPDGVAREHLRTTFYSLISEHPAFDTFTVVHDDVTTIRAYEEGTDDDPSPEGTRDISIVRPRDFHLYEFRNNPGHVYVTASVSIVRQIYRRARETHGQDLALRLRNTNLGSLEAALGSTEVIGYKLVNVLSTTPIRAYAVEGEDIRNNREVQDARSRAGQMKALAVRLQHDFQVIEVWVSANGTVTFMSYPGDAQALGLLEHLEPVIDRCSVTELATVR